VKKESNRLVELSWKIVECKLTYYRPDLVHKDWKEEITRSDQQYDAYENEYRDLCKTEGVEPYSCEMVGFDLERASARVVMEKYRNKKPKTKKGRSNGTVGGNLTNINATL